MTLVPKKFKNFMRKNKTNLTRREGKNKSEPEPKKDVIICYKCKNLGYLKNKFHNWIRSHQPKRRKKYLKQYGINQVS